MCARISRGFVLIVVVAFSALGGCQRATEPHDGSSTPTEIEHLSIGPLEVEALVNVEDPKAIAEVLAILSEEQLSTLARGDVAHVEDSSVSLQVAMTVGLDAPRSAVTDGGVLLASTPMTWTQLECCYAGNASCCKKKKEQ